MPRAKKMEGRVSGGLPCSSTTPPWFPSSTLSTTRETPLSGGSQHPAYEYKPPALPRHAIRAAGSLSRRHPGSSASPTPLETEDLTLSL
ncbi:hypothetical protein E2C01_078123 [Portunus trituberculatus]|uniref:Uncharacterized protein n=1 Tax=Portunus trituberculatus TaxID=210409 RepID=A0A5B7ITA9_PORTR|nr:hypothetical protein [Portunus trituberculatus]